MSIKLPHYIRQSIELKETFKDDTNYFLQQYVDPDEEKRKQLELIKQRQDKARRYSLKIRKKAFAAKKSQKSSKPLISSNNQISSNLARISNKDHNASKLKIHFQDHDTNNHQLSQSNKNHTSLEERVEILEAKLQETQSKYLHFILRGNPTNKRQINAELKWLFAQIRCSVMDELHEKDGMKYQDLRKEISHLRELLNDKDELLNEYVVEFNKILKEQQNGVSSVQIQNVTQKLQRFEQVLSKCHNFRYDHNIKNSLDLDSSLNRLESIVNKIHNKSGKVITARTPKHVSVKKGKMSKKVVKTKQKCKQLPSQSKLKSQCRFEHGRLKDLNARMSKLDQELRKSNSVLDDMLLKHS